MSWERNNDEIRGWARGVKEYADDLDETIKERAPETVEEVKDIIQELRDTYLGDDDDES